MYQEQDNGAFMMKKDNNYGGNVSSVSVNGNGLLLGGSQKDIGFNLRFTKVQMRDSNQMMICGMEQI